MIATLTDWMVSVAVLATPVATALLGATYLVRDHGARRVLLAGTQFKLLFPAAIAAPVALLAAPTPAADASPWLIALIAGYLSVVLALLGRIGIAHVELLAQLSRSTAVDDVIVRTLAARAGLRRAPTLYLSPDPSVGVHASGVLQPRILMSATLARRLTRTQLEQVLTHEIAHLQRHDPAWLLAAHLVRAICWFHPLAWLLVHATRRCAEDACDDAVLQQCGIRPDDYCETIIAAGRAGLTPSLAAGMAHRPLRRRLRRLLQASPRTASRLTLALAILGVLTLLPVTVASAATGDEPDRTVIRIVR